MFEHTFLIFDNLIQPIHFLFLASLYLPTTILSLIQSRDFETLLSLSRFKSAWFARFWYVYGSLSREGAIPVAAPLLQQAHGVVLDIGPGGGEWLGCFEREKVTKIYGVEPNKECHEILQRKIQEAGLEGIYVIVPVGVEELESGKWIREGKVDFVVTIRCLCSVDRPRDMIRDLYGLLKEGGSWIVFEHVICKGRWWIAWYQRAMDLLWPHFIGGCSITRDTERWLKEVGPWSKVDLGPPEPPTGYEVLPHVVGVLVK